jgi:hypothetical protein
VAALAGLARDLPLERVLPTEFRPLFQAIKDEVQLVQRNVQHARCAEQGGRLQTDMSSLHLSRQHGTS